MPQRVSIGLVGPSSHTNPAQQTARTINLYPEANDGDAKAPVALFSCPGLLNFGDLSDVVTSATELRGTLSTLGRMFWVAGNTLLEVTTSGPYLVWGTIPTTTGPVVLSYNNGVVIVGDGAAFTLFDLNAGTVTALTDGVNPIRGWFSDYLDGRTYYLEKDTDRFFWSALDNAATVEGLDFATAEGNPDPAVFFAITNREAVFGGTQSVEFWGPTGDSNNPLQRISGGYRDIGFAARWGAQRFADAVVFISQDEDGFAQVRLQGPAGGSPNPISNHGVERDIQIALRDYDGEDIRSYTYTEPGHKFWVLSLPNDVTWAFDQNTGLWHERAELNASTGLFKRIRQEHHAFWQGEHYVGGSRSAVLYKQGRQYYDLGGDPLIRQRTTSPLYAKGAMITVRGVEAICQVGVGLDGTTGQGSDPTMLLEVSTDGGYTFGNPMSRDLGAVGQYRTRVRWGPCGRGQSIVFRHTVSDPVPVTLVDGLADVDIGR